MKCHNGDCNYTTVEDIPAGGSISEHITMLGVHRQLVHPARPPQPVHQPPDLQISAPAVTRKAVSLEDAYEYVKKENRRTMAKDTMYPPPELLLVERNMTRNNFDIFMKEWRMYEAMTMPPCGSAWGRWQTSS
jgi:hypothetical protein